MHRKNDSIENIKKIEVLLTKEHFILQMCRLLQELKRRRVQKAFQAILNGNINNINININKGVGSGKNNSEAELL